VKEIIGTTTIATLPCSSGSTGQRLPPELAGGERGPVHPARAAVAFGYPAWDDAATIPAMPEFANIFNVKRRQPGEIPRLAGLERLPTARRGTPAASRRSGDALIGLHFAAVSEKNLPCFSDAESEIR
jgi:hypothetical protein